MSVWNAEEIPILGFMTTHTEQKNVISNNIALLDTCGVISLANSRLNHTSVSLQRS